MSSPAINLIAYKKETKALPVTIMQMNISNQLLVWLSNLRKNGGRSKFKASNGYQIYAHHYNERTKCTSEELAINFSEFQDKVVTIITVECEETQYASNGFLSEEMRCIAENWDNIMFALREAAAKFREENPTVDISTFEVF